MILYLYSDVLKFIFRMLALIGILFSLAIIIWGLPGQKVLKAEESYCVRVNN